MDKPNRYWFPAKRFGWGWGPPTAWQGWLVLAVWLAVFFTGSRYLALHAPRSLAFWGFLLVMAVLLLLVCYIKGEPPGWRWGGR